MDSSRSGTGRSGRRRAAGSLALGLIVGILGAAFALPAGAAVYKWADPQGNVHYTDKPPPPEGTLISVDDRNLHPRQEASPPPAASNAPSGPTDPAVKKAVDADVANAHGDDCKKAQDRYTTYIRSRRLYKEGPDKERIYLTDAELEAERVNAKKELDEFCANSEQR